MLTQNTTQTECVIIPLHRPDFKETLFFFFSGMLMSVPLSLFAETLSRYFLQMKPAPFYGELLSIAIIAPVLEEFAKAFPLFYRHGETERSIFSLGFYTGLGFGLIELLVYVFGFGAPIIVRLPAFLFHATNTSIVAYGIAKRKTLPFYLIPVLLHFLYNFSAFLGNPWFFIGLPSVAASLLISLSLYFKTSKKMIEYS